MANLAILSTQIGDFGKKSSGNTAINHKKKFFSDGDLRNLRFIQTIISNESKEKLALEVNK